MAAALISYYTEVSDDFRFLSRSDYQIDWQKMVIISRNYGYISSSEIIVDNSMTRISLWTNENSYDDWLRDEYVQQYITQRNNYNDIHRVKYYTTLVKL